MVRTVFIAHESLYLQDAFSSCTDRIFMCSLLCTTHGVDLVVKATVRLTLAFTIRSTPWVVHIIIRPGGSTCAYCSIIPILQLHHHIVCCLLILLKPLFLLWLYFNIYTLVHLNVYTGWPKLNESAWTIDIHCDFYFKHIDEPKFHLARQFTTRYDTTRYLAHAFWTGKVVMCCVAFVGQHGATRASRLAQYARHARHDRRDSHNTCSGASPQCGLGWTCPSHFSRSCSSDWCKSRAQKIKLIHAQRATRTTSATLVATRTTRTTCVVSWRDAKSGIWAISPVFLQNLKGDINNYRDCYVITPLLP